MLCYPQGGSMTARQLGPLLGTGMGLFPSHSIGQSRLRPDSKDRDTGSISLDRGMSGLNADVHGVGCCAATMGMGVN